MKVLLVTGDTTRAEALARDTGGPATGMTVDVAASIGEAITRLADHEYDGCVVDVVQPADSAGGGPMSQLRQPASHVPLVAIVGDVTQAAEAVGLGADGVVRPGPKLAASIADTLRAARTRRKQVPLARLRVLFVTDTEAVRDPAFMLRVNIEKVSAEMDRATLPPPYDSGPLAYDACVVDMTGGAMTMVEVLQDVVARAAGQPVIVLADATDRTVAATAIRMGAAQIIDKNGVWPLRVLAALDYTIGASRKAAELSSLQASYARMRQILDGLPIGVALVLPDGNILAMNPAGLGVAGLETFSPMNLLEKVPASDRAAVEAWLYSVAAGTAQAIQLRWDGDGTVRTLDFNGAPLPVGNQGALVLATVAATPL